MISGGRVWQQLQELFSSTTTHAVLVAPFIKTEVFEAVLAALPQTVDDIVCITRWSVMEIAAGVSDPEIVDIADKDGRPKVMLCHDLHAKIYIGDDRCLVGSANLTGKATGRVQPENFEVLVEVPANHAETRAILERIEATAVQATSELGASLREQANLFQKSDFHHGAVVVAEGPEQVHSWYPQTRAPERVYPEYRGRGTDYPRSIREAIVSDLAYLNLPPGLDLQAFTTEIKAKLRAIPEVQTLFANSRLNSSDLQQKITEHIDITDDEAKRAAENLAAWLEYFDEAHTVPVGAWEIRQGREHT